jgi:hypothetical protein
MGTAGLCGVLEFLDQPNLVIHIYKNVLKKDITIHLYNIHISNQR